MSYLPVSGRRMNVNRTKMLEGNLRKWRKTMKARRRLTTEESQRGTELHGAKCYVKDNMRCPFFFMTPTPV